MIRRLYERIGFPEASHLGKRVFKKLFVENAPLTATDKKTLQKDVDGVVWQYTLKPSTIPIKAYEDDKREYLEVAVLEVVLRSRRTCNRLAEVIHRAIPYPLLIAFSFESECCLSVAPKRFSQSEKGVIIAEDSFTTPWIDLECPTGTDQAFLDSLALSELSHTNFLAFYSGWVERILAYVCAAHTGTYSVNLPRQGGQMDRAETLKELERLERELSELRSKLKKEKNLGNQVQLNTQCKQIKDRMEAIKAEI